MTVRLPASIIAAGVTSWPREGVALLILLALILVIVAIALNRRSAARVPVIPPDERDALAPPSSDPVAGMRERYDL